MENDQDRLHACPDVDLITCFLRCQKNKAADTVKWIYGVWYSMTSVGLEAAVA